MNILQFPNVFQPLKLRRYSYRSSSIPMAPSGGIPGFQVTKYSYRSSSIPMAPSGGIPGLQVTRYSYRSSSMPMAPSGGITGLQVTKYSYRSSSIPMAPNMRSIMGFLPLAERIAKCIPALKGTEVFLLILKYSYGSQWGHSWLPSYQVFL